MAKTIKVELPNDIPGCSDTISFLNAEHRVTRTDQGCDLEIQVEGELEAYFPAGSWRHFTIENPR